MADRYWVGGTASWDGTAGTKWATTSGGAGGASVPTTADDVFFDAASTGTVTIATGNTGAKSINCTGFTGTITGSANITVAGSVTLVAGMTYTHTGTVTITGTGTLTTAGKSFSGLTVNGTGITVTLGDALNTGGRDLTVTAGTFDTASYSVTVGRITSSSGLTRVITLGSSTVTVTGGPVTVDFGSNSGSAAGLTLNAGTSNISMTYTSLSSQFRTGSNLTFYNVSYTGVANVNRYILGPTTATFNDLTFPNSGAGIGPVLLGVNLTVNGTLNCSGLTFGQRNFIFSDTTGTQRTITAAAISATDCDFRDINLAGAASGAAPTRAGDCGGNTGITFPAAKTVYRVGTNTTWAGSSSWATSSGGAGADANFPLPQDTAIVDNSTSGGSVTFGAYNFGTFDASLRTTAYSLSFSAAGNRYGSLTLSSAISVSGTGTQTFAGRSTMTLTSAGKSFTFSITLDAPGGTLTLADALTLPAANLLNVLSGTFDASSYNVTCGTFSATGAVTRTVNMGSGTWTVSAVGATPWSLGTTTNLTFNKGTANILVSGNSAAKTFDSGGLSYNKLTIGGATNTSSFSINGAASFTELDSIRTVAYSLIFNNNLGTIDIWSAKGTAGNLITFVSNTAGTRRTFNLTNVTDSSVNYLAVKDIGVNQANRFYVGANSVDNGNNLNVLFSTSPNALATVTGVTGTSAVGTATVPQGIEVTGVQGTGAVGTPSVSLGSRVSVTGVVGTTAVGNVSLPINAAVNVTNVTGAGLVGTASVAGAANVDVTTVAGTGEVGTALVSITVNADVTTVAGTGEVGTVAVTGKANIDVTTVAGLGEVGTPAVVGVANVPVTGVTGASAVGSVFVAIGSTVAVTGVTGTSAVGTALVAGSSNVRVVGVQAFGNVAKVLVWGVINDNQTPNWQAVDDSQAGSWSQVADGNTVVWAQIPT